MLNDQNNEEVQRLRGAMRDVIAIASLPSIWSHYDVDHVAESLVETLYRSLFLDFAYVCIKGPHRSIPAAYSRSGFMQKSSLEKLNATALAWLESQTLSAGIRSLPHPFADGFLQVNVTPIGYSFKSGILITHASREQFPTESDRLILNIASNQTNVVVEHKWAQLEAETLLKIAEERESQLREATKLAEIAKTEAIQANELKSSFLANMSHEIRTPLGAILGFADVLKSPSLNPDQRNEYLDIIARSGRSLNKIIDDILDLSKIEAGKLEIEALPLSVAAVCREVMAMFSDHAHSKGIDLIFDGSQLPQFSVHSDPIRIRQVLVNLIGNAMKFTSHGSITVRGSYTRVSGDMLRVTLTVSDTGMGISKVVSDSLFKPFTQGDNTSTRKFGGTGLGLALSKKLGNALGGDVALTRCEEGKGCTFTFDFLAPGVSDASGIIQESRSPDTNDKLRLRGFKVLVADDSPDNRLLMNVILKRQGAEVHFAVDGEEAVEKVLNEEYDVILMDIQMPKLDGYGALAKLRQGGYRNPIFALTAHAMKEERNRALDSGFVDHVTKPVNAKELTDSILRHTRH